MGIETLVARALNKVLGNFVEDISPESLKLAVLSGRASLE
jgi:formate dehydrogenase assembly factor FdhD